jgi:UDP-2,4-diacetamido-2,4,6-trideoxy-beta-L-altropyranose hydrolase
MNRGAEETLLIRADCGAHIGSGHVIRCLALAQTWQDMGGKVGFSMAMKEPTIQARLQKEKVELFQVTTRPGSTEDAIQFIDKARQMGASVVVVDGYQFNAEYQRCIKEAGLRLLIIDDNAHLDHYYADVLVNQNLHATKLDYQCDPETVLLLGPRYALLRQEFLRWKTWKRTIPHHARRILITLGGMSNPAYYMKVVEYIEGIESVECDIIFGSTEPPVSLEEKAQLMPERVRLYKQVKDMPALMAGADIAISSSGSTMWEIAFMGLPSILFVLSHNQQEVAESLSSIDAVEYLGWLDQVDAIQAASSIEALLEDQETRMRMSQQLTNLVDGLGVGRVIQVIKELE